MHHYYAVFIPYIYIVLHARILGAFRRTNIYFMPTLYHNNGANVYISHPLARSRLLADLDWVSRYTSGTNLTFI